MSMDYCYKCDILVNTDYSYEHGGCDEKNGKPVYAKDLNFNERHNNLTNHPDTKSKYNKDGSIITEPKKEEKISLMKPMAGKTYQVTKIGGLCMVYHSFKDSLTIIALEKIVLIEINKSTG